MLNHCEVCGRNLVFVTSGALGIGGLVNGTHPFKCVPVKYAEDEPEDRVACDGPGGNSPVKLYRTCAWSLCRKRFSTYARAKKCCSDFCREEKRRHCQRAANRRYWHRTKVKQAEAEALQAEVRRYTRRKVA